MKFLIVTTFVLLFGGFGSGHSLRCAANPVRQGPERNRSAAPPAQAKPSSKPAPAAVDINLATAEDFQKLPGVGPKLAQRIVDYRQRHGPFRRVEDLMAIRGIGFKKWKALRPYLRLSKQVEK